MTQGIPPRQIPWSRWRRAAQAWTALLLAAGPAGAADRAVQTEVHHVPSSPVEIRTVEVRLVERFQLPGEEQPGRRVRYANRKSRLAPRQQMLRGRTVLVNRSRHTVEALALTVMPRDAFRHAIVSQTTPPYTIHQVAERLTRGETDEIVWEQRVESDDVHAVVVLVTAVRFADGSIWTAPQEYVRQTFFP